MVIGRWVLRNCSQPHTRQRGYGHCGRDEMNTLQLIKARANRSKALEQARKQMAKAYGSDAHVDVSHTEVRAQNPKPLVHRGVTYQPGNGNQLSTGGRELRYRGICYGIY